MSFDRAPRALVVGASETAELLHLPVLAGLRDAGRLELVEICDLRLGNASSVRQKFGFARDGGDAANAVARDDIDVVYLFGGARMHHALGLAALHAGNHLFVEKPIAPSYSDTVELADAAEARGLVAVGGHNRRSLPRSIGFAPRPARRDGRRLRRCSTRTRSACRRRSARRAG
jgi:predicted dehydrogenase